MVLPKTKVKVRRAATMRPSRTGAVRPFVMDRPILHPLVAERARALAVLGRAGLVCAPAAAVAEPLPAPNARPEPIQVAPGAEVSLESLTEALAFAGYERVERADERGQFAVRGGIVDVFPTTGREPLRVEFWGDEIEGIRAFSPFTQRALHPVDDAVIYPAAERRLDLLDPSNNLSPG